jgi:hypothetical protein
MKKKPLNSLRSSQTFLIASLPKTDSPISLSFPHRPCVPEKWENQQCYVGVVIPYGLARPSAFRFLHRSLTVYYVNVCFRDSLINCPGIRRSPKRSENLVPFTELINVLDCDWKRTSLGDEQIFQDLVKSIIRSSGWQDDAASSDIAGPNIFLWDSFKLIN